MTATPFTPRAGSIGQRAIEYLTAHGPTEPDTLAAAIDEEIGTLNNSLKLCLQHGLVLYSGSIFYLPGQTYADLFPDPVIPKFLSEQRNPSEAITAKDKAQKIASAACAVSPYPSSPSVIGTPASRHFEFGSFSDGRFVIEYGEHVFTLTREDAYRLGNFVAEHGIGLPC